MSIPTQKAVMYGAGNIGRGFLGQIFSNSGYEVVFIDVDLDLVNALNKSNSYTQVTVDGDVSQSREITRVRAIDGNDNVQVAHEISCCCIMAVSVGSAVLPIIAPLIAKGISLRTKPLNILVCENLVNAPNKLRNLVSEYMTDKSLLALTGFAGTTIGRMVPAISPQERAANPALIKVEPFCTLPVDKDAVVRPFPALKHTILYSPFAFEEGKKLYIHNMGHSLAAYLGARKKYNYIWQAIEDDYIYSQVENAMIASAEALSKKFDENITDLEDYIRDLLKRFGNKGLGDTVSRVGGDPLRKLTAGDRLIGTVNLCKEQNVDYKPVLIGIAAALMFDFPDDPSSSLLKKQLDDPGIMSFLQSYCKLSETDSAFIAELHENRI